MRGNEALVLIVDDDEDSRTVAAEYLAFRGYRVATAEDGLAAVNLAVELLPDLVLIDLAMPVMDGCEATRRIKKDPRTQAIPVLALTAFGAEAEMVRGALEAGCLAVLKKPIPPRTLEAEVRRVVAGRKKGRRAIDREILRNLLEATAPGWRWPRFAT
jgi:CheY-like chemotaxis protein